MLIKNSFRVSQNDILNLSENSEEWIELKKNFERIVIFIILFNFFKIVHSNYTIKKKLQGIFDMIHLSNAAVSNGFKFKQSYLKVIGVGYFFAYYFFHSKEAQLESKKFRINTNFEIAQRVWNLLDTSMIKQFYIKSLPGIKYREKLYFKKTEKPLTKEFLSELIDKINNKTISDYTNSLIQNKYLKTENDSTTSESKDLFLKKISGEKKKGKKKFLKFYLFNRLRKNKIDS